MRIFLAFVFLFVLLSSVKAVNVHTTSCDTIYHINGDTLSVRIYKYNDQEVLYKFCNEFNRPVRKINAEFIYKIKITETGRIKKYNKSAKELAREQKRQKKKTTKRQKIIKATVMGALVGGIIGSILSVVLLSILPANPYISIALTFATIFILAFNTKIKEYKILTIISAVIAYFIGLVILNIFRSFI